MDHKPAYVKMSQKLSCHIHAKYNFFFTIYTFIQLTPSGGRDGVVGIATLRAGRCRVVRILVEARLSAPVQTGPGANQVPCTMGTGVSFPGGKSAGAWR